MWPVKSFLFTIINYFLLITKDQRQKAAAFPRAIVTRPSVKSKSVASCSGYEIGKTGNFPTICKIYAKLNTFLTTNMPITFDLRKFRLWCNTLFCSVWRALSRGTSLFLILKTPQKCKKSPWKCKKSQITQKLTAI